MLTKTSIARTEFTGKIAANYDRRRNKNSIWKHEELIINTILDSYDNNISILDIGIGTGRFFDIYKLKKFNVIGIDTSIDMLCLAYNKLDEDMNVCLINMNALKLDASKFKDTIDVVVCSRLISLLDTEDSKYLVSIIKEINPKEVIISNRESTEFNTHKCTLDRSVVCDCWDSYTVQRVKQSDFYVYRLYR